MDQGFRSSLLRCTYSFCQVLFQSDIHIASSNHYEDFEGEDCNSKQNLMINKTEP